MPININNDLPSAKKLSHEGVFIMKHERASTQDIRPLKIIIFNVMPTKEETEMQLMRLLGNSPLQVDITLLRPKSHQSKNTTEDYLKTYYKTFEEIKDIRFDGLIITGAPVETISFEEVDYFTELTRIMKWSKTNVYSTLHICWGAFAGLYYHFGIEKQILTKKMFGIFEHKINFRAPIMSGFDTYFNAPHSRNTQVLRQDIVDKKGIEIVSESDEAGVFVLAARKGRQIFITGHLEYDADTLKHEYERDIEKGLDIEIPKNYFKNDNPSEEPIVSWRAHANLFFVNWLNYYVYQKTPFDLAELSEV